jgi:hypothetical protein
MMAWMDIQPDLASIRVFRVIRGRTPFRYSRLRNFSTRDFAPRHMP